MARRTINRISATKLAALKTPGYHADGGILYHRIAPGGSRGWIFRYAQHGRTHDMGLGPYPEISLADARQLAFTYRRMLARGINPLAKRKAAQRRDRIAELEAEVARLKAARPT